MFSVGSGVWRQAATWVLGGLFLVLLTSTAHAGKAASGADPVADFWTWFQTVEEGYHADVEAMVAQEPGGRDRVIQAVVAVNERLARIDPYLNVNFGPPRGKTFELVLTVDGFKQAIPAIEKTAAVAPSLPRWTLVKYRPATARPGFSVQHEGATLKVDDVEAAVAKVEGDIVVVLFVKGLDGPQRQALQGAAVLAMDSVLGEELSMKAIDVLTAVPFSEQTAQGIERFPLLSLPARLKKLR